MFENHWYYFDPFCLYIPDYTSNEYGTWLGAFFPQFHFLSQISDNDRISKAKSDSEHIAYALDKTSFAACYIHVTRDPTWGHICISFIFEEIR